MKIALTGVTGHMGFATLKEILKLDFIDKVNVLVYPTDKKLKKIKRLKNKKVSIILGNIADLSACKELIKDMDYVVNMAAVIPPLSDNAPARAVECNEKGVKTLVKAIESLDPQPKLIHISTVALYGNRTSVHPFAQVGDPIMVSPFDIYSITKMRAEFHVLESNIKKFVVLRQTACLYDSFIFENLHDGLMFHTCFNSPLEWLTVEDSARLIANIIKRDTIEHDLDEIFWNKIFNIGGGKQNRITGYDTFNEGLKLFGKSAKDLFDTNFNATRNFHGVWFYDGDKLEEMFHYQKTTVSQFWKHLTRKQWFIKLATIVPRKILKKYAIERVRSHPNAPKYWFDNNEEVKMIAYFGGIKQYLSIPKDWKDFPLLVENYDENGKKIDFFALKDEKNANLVDYHFDITKTPTLEDLQNVARAHGGKLISTTFNSIYDKLTWRNSEGEDFVARPYTILYGGHWWNKSYEVNVWYYDRLSKLDEIYRQVWLDSHSPEENYVYFFDRNFKPKYIE